MPFEIDIDAARRRARVRCAGEGSLAEIEETTRSLVAAQGYEPEFTVLADVTGLAYVMPYPEALRLRELLVELRPRLRGPIAVVARPGVQYGATRVAASLGELVGLRVATFERAGDAERWLDEQAGGHA